MTSTHQTATLVRLGPARPARRRLFCLPYAGGGVSAYAQWWRHLPDDIAVFGVQLPGRESRLNEPPLTTIATMAEASCAAIGPMTDLPYAIFGHSMGALVAFEVALRLEADDSVRAPGHLFLSGRRAPETTEPEPFLSVMSDAELLDTLQIRFGAVTDEVRDHPELLELLVPLLRADVAAVESYKARPGALVRCPVDVSGGIDDRHPTPEALRSWQRWADQPMGVRLFEGDHFYLAPARQALLSWLSSAWIA